MASVGLVRGGAPVPSDVQIEPGGLRLRWPPLDAEGAYIGTWVAWSEMRDADPFATPPEVRLLDGRTLFVPVEWRDRLIRRLWEVGVPLAHRPEVWVHLLEPFFDTDDGALRERYDAELRAWGFDDDEVAGIRASVRRPMEQIVRPAPGWSWYGHVDLITAWSDDRLPPRWLRRADYVTFRRWTDELADRPSGGER
jgi:hypothetical protein